MIVLGEVLTNCEEDEYYRVKVKSPKVWEESELMPSLNGIYLDKGDMVIIDITDGVDNAYIKAKLRTKAQKDKSVQGEGVILYEAQKDGMWSAAWVTEQNLYWKNSDGVEVSIKGTDITIKQVNRTVEADDGTINIKNTLTVKADTVNVESENATVKATNCTLDGKVKFTHGFGPPDGKGPLCGIPNCLFSGAPQCSSETQ